MTSSSSSSSILARVKIRDGVVEPNRPEILAEYISKDEWNELRDEVDAILALAVNHNYMLGLGHVLIVVCIFMALLLISLKLLSGRGFPILSSTFGSIGGDDNDGGSAVVKNNTAYVMYVVVLGTFMIFNLGIIVRGMCCLETTIESKLAALMEDYSTNGCGLSFLILPIKISMREYYDDYHRGRSSGDPGCWDCLMISTDYVLEISPLFTTTGPSSSTKARATATAVYDVEKQQVGDDYTEGMYYELQSMPPLRSNKSSSRSSRSKKRYDFIQSMTSSTVDLTDGSSTVSVVTSNSSTFLSKEGTTTNASKEDQCNHHYRLREQQQAQHDDYHEGGGDRNDESTDFVSSITEAIILESKVTIVGNTATQAQTETSSLGVPTIFDEEGSGGDEIESTVAAGSTTSSSSIPSSVVSKYTQIQRKLEKLDSEKNDSFLSIEEYYNQRKMILDGCI